MASAFLPQPAQFSEASPNQFPGIWKFNAARSRLFLTNLKAENRFPDATARLTERLDTMLASLDDIKAALLRLRLAFVSAYAVLSDEQKARLVARAISERPQAAADPAANNQAEAVALDCRQWPAMLKSWPLSRIEGKLKLSDEQHTKLYALMAAIYRVRQCVERRAECAAQRYTWDAAAVAAGKRRRASRRGASIDGLSVAALMAFSQNALLTPLTPFKHSSVRVAAVQMIIASNQSYSAGRKFLV
jgi:hypothetical protein